MKTGGFDPQQTASQLDAARNRARLQQQVSQPPLNVPQPGAAQPSGARDSAPPSQNGLTVPGSARALRSTPGAGRGIGAAQRRLAASSRQQNRNQTSEPEDPNYPNPIGLRTFIAFGFFALAQDGLPLVFDLIGIGWLVAWVLFPITWSAYIYLIIRRAPKHLKRTMLERSAMAAGIGLIPVVGEVLPEWTTTAILVYVVIRRYERQKSYEGAGQASRSKTSAGAGKAVGALLKASKGG